ncbi:MAG: IPT/TIG domain-containing protein [Prevotellaceae bacterium]|nr:IPT/TIG domain-containing protein [Candidatus Minthosoma caballi]
MKKFINIFAYVMVALIGLSIAACSDDDYNTNPYSKSGVNLLAFGPCPMERTQEIRITGTNMDKVEKVIFPADATVEEAAVLKAEFNNVDKQNIYVNIPDATVPGNIKLVCGKDTVVSEGIITFEEPIEVTSIAPVKGLNAGDIITIKGDYVYNIASVTFTSGVTVPAEEFESASRRELKIRVPLAAESGVITMTDGDEWTEEYKEELEILSAKVTSISATEVEFGQAITITGTNLHTVESVFFPGGVAAEFTVSADNKTISTTVPAQTKSGAVSLLLYSGAAISTPEIAVPTVGNLSISKSKDICEGDELYISGDNLDRVVVVKIPGQTEDYKPEFVDGKIKVVVPEGMPDGEIVLVQNDYISVGVQVDVRKLAGVIWQGKTELVGWNGNWGVFNWDGALWDKFCETINTPGKLTIHFTQTKEAPVFKAKMGDWGTSFSSMSIPEEGEDPACRPAAGIEDLEIDLTAEEVEKMFGSGKQGIVLWGDGIQVQYVKWVAAGEPVVIWQGTEDMGAWSNQPYLCSDGGKEFIDAGVQEGWVVRFHGIATSANWQFQVFEGHWADNDNAIKFAGFKPDDSDPIIIEDLEAAGGYVSFKLTQKMIDMATTQQWWGGIWVVQGQDFILEKITVAPF